ncbi:MAG: GtrA family protein [Azospirillum sp.]|nr:GtrA family protein [Azospirillum sp.]
MFNKFEIVFIVVGKTSSSFVAIFTMRYYVFRSAENLKQEYIKAWGVYLSTMLLNYAAMFVMVDILNINQLGAQAFYTLFSVVFTYIMHKYFSFCRKNQPAK